jgi:hypothetical protein
MKKRYDDSIPVSEQYPVTDLRYNVTPFNVATPKIIDASNDVTIAPKPKKQGNKTRKSESVPFIPVTRKPSKKRVTRPANLISTVNSKGKKETYHVFWTNGNDASYNGKITPIDAGMNVHTCLAESERDTCPKHKQKRIR